MTTTKFLILSSFIILLNGCSLLSEKSTKQDKAASELKSLQNACLANNFEACHFVATSEYENENYKLATKIFKIGCNSNFFQSCSSLGTIEYKNGNFLEASKYYEKACAGMVQSACRGLELIEFQKNNYKDLIAEDEECTTEKTMKCPQAGFKNFLTGRIDVAIKNLELACNANFKYSCLRLAAILYQMGNTSRAIQLYQNNCNITKDTASCNTVKRLKQRHPLI